MAFRVLIIGGTGQVGAAVVGALAAEPSCAEIVMVNRRAIERRDRSRDRLPAPRDFSSGNYRRQCSHPGLCGLVGASDPGTFRRDRAGRYRARLCRRIRQPLGFKRGCVSRKWSDETEVSCVRGSKTGRISERVIGRVSDQRDERQGPRMRARQVCRCARRARWRCRIARHQRLRTRHESAPARAGGAAQQLSRYPRRSSWAEHSTPGVRASAP
jgi:hypothetical protein